MKQNKLLILSLLASFLLLTMVSYVSAQNAVTFGTVDDCPKPVGSTVDVVVLVENGVDIAALDIVGQIVSDGNVDLVVTGITFDDRMGFPETLDQRFPVSDCGGAFRFGAIQLNETYLMAGSGQIATLTLEYLSDCVLGTATIDEATGDQCGNDVITTFVGTDAVSIAPTVNSGAVNVVNAAPWITNCPGDFSEYWGTPILLDIDADDPDLACGCDALSFSVTSGPGSINVDGIYQYTPLGADVGCQPIEITVTDSYGGTDVCSFTISVLNMAPIVDECPSEVINILWGQTAVAQVHAYDPDSGPSGLTYTVAPNGHPGSGQVNPGTGAFTWVTSEENAYIGDFEFTVIASDGANVDACNTENADSCTFVVHVEPKFQVTIEKVHDQLLGHFTSVSIDLSGSYTSMEMGGYDFLIAYDASILTFVDAEPGALLDACGWEYFTYRFGPDGNCGGACPSGMLRLVAMAETNNGAAHPSCFDSDAGTQLAVLNFFVTRDHTHSCLYQPIKWYWLDCGDNTISSKFGDTLHMVDNVFKYYGDDGADTWINVTNHDGFPSFTGNNDICLEGDKEYPLRSIDFKEGGIDIICDSAIDGRGDINVNGIDYEIADAVMFTNFFISGLSAFGDHAEASIAASDANADGVTLTVADLVYMVRVIQGDALAYPKELPNHYVDAFDVKTQVLDNVMTVKYDASVEVGGVYLVFDINGTVGEPTLIDGASSMDVTYNVDGNELRIVIVDLYQADAIQAGAHDLLSIPVNGSLTLREVEAADFNGAAMTSTTRVLPTKFELAQNYPNPFNPSTKIMLRLPVASDYSVAIYNIAGQLIRTYSGNASAGDVSVVWDGKDASGSQVASGMYFYKANASSFSASKKMILMK